ncbi:kinase domain-containing protein [Sclerotinia borealis F-4128]|uniref:Kinase domain-containing protein n=1 Tax=Sclerotinia borealis (strain F-4128) TaxID=1432307 RepID=W9CDA1_SCLBF|nr:kinase domain-containing protein [Sclerotinia borealis F-4128]
MDAGKSTIPDDAMVYVKGSLKLVKELKGMDLISAVSTGRVTRGPNKTIIPRGSYYTEKDLIPGDTDPEDTVILYQYGNRSIKRLPDGLVLKSGPSIRLAEAAAMDLAAKHGLPVPKSHGVCEPDQENGRRLGWIKMDFVEGTALEDVWADLNKQEKLDICHQLRDILIKMRTIEPPTQGTINSCDNSSIKDGRNISDYQGGPFKNETEFNEFILDFGARPPVALEQAIRNRMPTGHRTVLTHCDLSPRNIMVRDGKITGLIDWEDGGFFPEYWEYVKFFEAFTKHRDWKDYSDEIMPQKYDDELLFFQVLLRWQRS